MSAHRKAQQHKPMPSNRQVFRHRTSDSSYRIGPISCHPHRWQRSTNPSPTTERLFPSVAINQTLLRLRYLRLRTFGIPMDWVLWHAPTHILSTAISLRIKRRHRSIRPDPNHVCFITTRATIISRRSIHPMAVEPLGLHRSSSLDQAQQSDTIAIQLTIHRTITSKVPCNDHRICSTVISLSLSVFSVSVQ